MFQIYEKKVLFMKKKAITFAMDAKLIDKLPEKTET